MRAHACKILVCAHAYKLLIGNIVITKEDVQAGVNDDASFFPAMMDVFIGVTALFVAWGGGGARAGLAGILVLSTH
jgi:hypothetical protein